MEIVLPVLSTGEKLAYIARHANPGPVSISEVEYDIRDAVEHSLFGLFLDYDELVDMTYQRVLWRISRLN